MFLEIFCGTAKAATNKRKKHLFLDVSSIILSTRMSHDISPYLSSEKSDKGD